MRFRVCGADRETGEDIEIVIEAPDERSAQAKANKKGILVTSCKREGQGTPSIAVRRSSAATPQPPAPPPKMIAPPSALVRLARNRLVVIGAVAAAAVTIPFVGYSIYTGRQRDAEIRAQAERTRQLQDRAHQSAEEGIRALESQLAATKSPPVRPSATVSLPKTQTSEIEADYLIRQLVRRYPELDAAIRRNDQVMIDSAITLMIATGDYDADDAVHVRSFARRIESLPR